MRSQNQTEKKLNMRARQLALLKPVAICISLAIILLVVVLLSIAGVGKGGKSTDKNMKSQETALQEMLFKEEKKHLLSIIEYLSGIDEIVMSNREQLSEISLYSTDTEKTLDSFSEFLSNLEQNILKVETDLKNFTVVSKSGNTTINTALAVLSNRQQEIKEQITSASEAIYTLLSDTKTENQIKLDQLQVSADEIQKKAKAYYKDLVNIIGLFRAENQQEHEGLLNALTSTSDEMKTLIEEEFSAMQIQNSQNFLSLTEQMDSLHMQIGVTEQFIADLLHMMEKNSEHRQAEIRDGFASLNIWLEQINMDFNTAHEEIQNQISILEENGTFYHEETLSALTVMEESMTIVANQNLNQIANTLLTMQNNFETSLSSMQNEISNNFTALNTDMEVRLNQMSQRILNQYDSLSTTINNSYNGQQTNLEAFTAAIRGDLQSLFQYVSNGKRSLASALLTKGVTVRADATFNEIRQGILNIPQQLLIGVEQIPGTISYDYHYHVDANGGYPHNNSMSVRGGCYTKAVYHAHSDANGCYKITEYHSHNSSCPGHSIWVDWNTSVPEGYWAWSYDCGNRPLNASTKDLVCSKSTSTIDYYNPGCGLSDGQIIGAHIVYNNTSPLSAPLFTTAPLQMEITGDDNMLIAPGDDSILTAPEPANEKPPSENGENNDLISVSENSLSSESAANQ